ncbi:PREDICTED: uncharacterized protein LOC109244315 [Nicotiana attenuata]|uniref:uncharacterized protein LOC109244315 n=1 Tax=Nicotiana attenuata TaxID=49451 RepID=UPI0009047462|nr:PREDICTED: uncharacterized protein LOC109244315 [Nicotiana attenuata]
MSPLPMPPRPSMPASQSSDFFKVPPPSSSLQYYSMPSHGGSASTTINLIPTPHFPASSPCGPASQIGSSPPIASSSHHSSQHGGSSFVPHTSATQLSSPASSTPSISNLDIGGSHAAASPSTSTSTVAGTVRHCTGGTVQYDHFHRLIIIPHNVGFLPSFQAAHMVMESMKPFFDEPWNSWKQIPYQIRMNKWQQFKVQCVWQQTFENLVHDNFEKKAQKLITNSHHVARKGGKKPNWIREDVWNQLLAKWNTPEWKKKSEQAKLNRASIKGGALHTGGSISFEAHRWRMGKELEVFAETRKKKKEEEDGTREGWIEPRALEIFDKYHIDLDAWQQTQPEGTRPTSEDMTAIWTQAAGGVNKGRVYGIGVQPSSSRPPTTLFTGASVSQEDMESMRQKVDQISQELQETQALIQKLIKKKQEKSCNGV